MVAYEKPRQRKKEEREKLREEETRSSLLILDLKEWKLFDSGREEEGKASINCMH